ncbi:MAG: SDR family oxidoreductase [Candidatus Schekmanbacteria bacterium]|nr:SDR family oxidoreductase [Candidatus Schekmanbacteria bacterium]
MPRALVTGGAGFLGSHLCEYLLNKNFQVICMDNLLTGSIDNIAHLYNQDFLFVKHDVTNYIFIEGHLDYIFHLASPASPIDYLEYPIQTLKVGSLGTHKALGLAKEKQARFLLASTSEVYGDPLVHPQKESYWGNVNPIGPRGVYDEAKRFSEALVMAYQRTHGLETRIVRIFNTYGPRMRLYDGRVVPTLMRQLIKGEPLTIFGDGRQTRSFCYVSDLIEGIYRLMLSDYPEPVNIGNPNEMLVVDLAHKLLQMSAQNNPLEFKPLPVDDPKVRQPDITLAREKLGWEPEVGLDEGLKKTLEWMQGVLNKGAVL